MNNTNPIYLIEAKNALSKKHGKEFAKAISKLRQSTKFFKSGEAEKLPLIDKKLLKHVRNSNLEAQLNATAAYSRGQAAVGKKGGLLGQARGTKIWDLNKQGHKIRRDGSVLYIPEVV